MKVEHYMNEMKCRKLEMDSITYDRIINIYLKYNMVNVRLKCIRKYNRLRSKWNIYITSYIR